MTNEGEVYKLIITAPRVEDSGKYLIDINTQTCFANLSVEEPDPTYNFIKMLDNPFDDTMYCEVKFLGMNAMVEFEHTTIKTIFEYLYKGKVVAEDGELDQDKVERFIEKYGTPVSTKLQRSNNNTNTIIIHDESPNSGVNINLGRH